MVGGQLGGPGSDTHPHRHTYIMGTCWARCVGLGVGLVGLWVSRGVSRRVGTGTWWLWWEVKRLGMEISGLRVQIGVGQHL